MAYDPDIEDRNADQHIIYYILKEDQQPLIGIDKSGCMKLKKPLDRDPPNGYSMWTVSYYLYVYQANIFLRNKFRFFIAPLLLLLTGARNGDRRGWFIHGSSRD